MTGPTTRGGTDTGSGGWYRGGSTTRGVGVDNPPATGAGRPEVQRGQRNSGASTPPPVVRRPVERPQTDGTRSNPPRDSVKPPNPQAVKTSP